MMEVQPTASLESTAWQSDIEGLDFPDQKYQNSLFWGVLPT